MRNRLLAVAGAAALIATACGGSTPVAVEPPAAPTPTALPTTAPPTTAAEPTPAPTATAVPAATSTALPTEVPEPTATPQPQGPCGVGPLALPDPNRPVYAGSVSIDPQAGTVVGDLTVDFTPDLVTDELVVRLWPNGPRTSAGGIKATLLDATASRGSASGDGAPIALGDAIDTGDPTLLRFPLAEPLGAGETLRAEFSFELVVPGQLRSRVSGDGTYLRLGTVLPLLPWEPGVGWATEPATSLFAEAVMSPTADYSIAIRVPDGYDVLASGLPDDDGVWRVQAARDFAISVGRFRIVSAIAMAPEPVEVVVGVHEGLGDDPDVYLAKVVTVLEEFSARFGQYPWPSLTFALTPGLTGGIEFPTHIMQGPDTIGRTTTHEVGHMFFYSLVGNNQGTAPWLDEGLASYAEFTFEGQPAGFLTIPTSGVGEATRPMTFWENRGDIYYRSVYSQTGFALQRLGDQAEVDCALAQYVADNAFGIARADDFVDAFEPRFPDVVDQLAGLGVVITDG